MAELVSRSNPVFLVNIFFFYSGSTIVFDKRTTSFDVLLGCTKETQFEILRDLDLIEPIAMTFKGVPEKEKLFLSQSRTAGGFTTTIFDVHRQEAGSYIVWTLRYDIVVSSQLGYLYRKASGFNRAFEKHPPYNVFATG